MHMLTLTEQRMVLVMAQALITWVGRQRVGMVLTSRLISKRLPQ